MPNNLGWVNAPKYLLIHSDLFLLRAAQVFTDSEGRIFAAKPCQPKKGWIELVGRVEKAIQEVRAELKLSSGSCNTRRGKFPSITFGVSHGNGQTVSSFYCRGFTVWPKIQQPAELKLKDGRRELLLKFCENPDVQKLVAHIHCENSSSLFAILSLTLPQHHSKHSFPSLQSFMRTRRQTFSPRMMS